MKWHGAILVKLRRSFTYTTYTSLGVISLPSYYSKMAPWSFFSLYFHCNADDIIPDTIGHATTQFAGDTQTDKGRDYQYTVSAY